MPKTIEERLETLEQEMNLLKVKADAADPGRDWISAIIGSFAGDPEFDEIVRFGKELRNADRPTDHE